MDINNILKADILDIIFEGKNKEYGAYELRKTYRKRITNSILFTLLFCLLFFISFKIFGKEKKESLVIVEDVKLENLQQEEKKPELPPPPPPPKQPEPPKVEITKFTPPKIVPDIEVKEDEKPPEMDKLEDTKIGTVNQEGKKDDQVPDPPKEVTTGGTEKPKEMDYDQTFTHVENEAEFPGGAAAWKRYLERNVNAEVAKDGGAPAGRYTVLVSFIVDKEGNISNVSGAYQGSGDDYGTVEEAVKAVTKGGKWSPGIQNGIKVKSHKTQPITFIVNEE